MLWLMLQDIIKSAEGSLPAVTETGPALPRPAPAVGIKDDGESRDGSEGDRQSAGVPSRQNSEVEDIPLDRLVINPNRKFRCQYCKKWFSTMAQVNKYLKNCKSGYFNETTDKVVKTLSTFQPGRQMINLCLFYSVGGTRSGCVRLNRPPPQNPNQWYLRRILLCIRAQNARRNFS